MSRIKVSSNIKKIVDSEESFENGAELKNLFISATEGEVDEFVSDYCAMNSWVLNSTQAAAFAQNLITVLDGSVTKEEVVFIHAQCYKKIITADDRNDPIRFEVLFDGNSIGKMSQFQMANIVDLVPESIEVKSPEIIGDTQCILAVVIGFNKK